MLTVPNLTQRATNGSPLTIAQGDQNVQSIQDFLTALNAQVSESISDNGTLKVYFLDTGSLNAYQINPAEFVAIPQPGDYQPAYFNGLLYFIKAGSANTGAATLSVQSQTSAFLPPIPILLNGAPLQGGEIVQGQVFGVIYDLPTNSFNMISGGGNSTASSSGNSLVENTTAIVPNLNVYSPADVALPGANTAATYPHGFTTTPNGVDVELVCITNDSGFTVGQHVPVTAFFNTSNQPAFEIQSNPTNIIVTQGASGPKVIAPTGGSIGTAVTITQANWRLRVSAFIYTAPNIYQSPATPLTGANTLITLAHGLNLNPDSYVGLLNATAEQGFNPGDFVPLRFFFDGNANPAFESFSDSVNIYVQQNNVSTLVSAAGTLTFTNQPGNGGTVVLGATTYTFQTVLINSANNILIGVNLSASIANLVSAIMATSGAGTTYGTGTTANASATAVGATNSITATAITAGTAGNSVVSTPTVVGTANCSWTSGTLTGGINAPQVICVSGANIGTAQPITPANWSISAFAFAPQKQTSSVIPANDFVIANPDGAFGYNQDIIVFNMGRLTTQTYISSIDTTTSGVTPLQVLPNSNFTVRSQNNNITPFRFNDGLDRLVWCSSQGIWSLVLGQFTNAATAANGTLTFPGTDKPADGDTVTVDAKVYTFKTTLSNVAGYVLIGSAYTNSMANLWAAMTLGAGAGTTYAAATTLDSNFTAVISGSTIVVTASQSGTAGNSLTTAASSPVNLAYSWGSSTLAGGTGNALVRYTTADLHGQKPVWVDQTTSTANPDFYCVGSDLNPGVTVFPTTSVPMSKTRYTGSAYVAATPFGTNLNLHSPLIVSNAAFNAFHNVNKGNVATDCHVALFQYNPVKKRIYVTDVETGFLFIFNIQGYTASNNISDWWNQSDSVRYPQMTFEKSIAIGGNGNLNAVYDKDKATVSYDLTTGQENSIVITRTGNALTVGSVSYVPWPNFA